MHRLRGAVRALTLGLVAVLLATGGPVQPVRGAATGPDPSDIVLVLDFSGSILEDEAARTDFATALDGIADRVDEIADTLVAGDMAVSLVIFATRATDVPGCTELELRDDPGAVETLADCLREIASTYRNGGSPELVANIGDDTNYVDAMEVAAGRLPDDSVRPAIIFFTDGRHEVDDVPVEEVIPARDRLFGDRSPFGLLPVGMGVDPDDREVLEAGLLDLRITNDLERCEGGALDWPNVVFETAEEAGQAVALALQDVSCTFTVEPTPTPAVTPAPTVPPTATPVPSVAGAPVRSIRIVPGDATLEVTWREPQDAATAPIEDYQVRCRPTSGGEQDWILGDEGVSTETSATFAGLANGVQYTCEVAAVRGGVPGAWTRANATGTPFGRPPTPLKPTVQALDGGARITVAMPAAAPVAGFTYECSSDGGETWEVQHTVEGSQLTNDVPGLTNGRDYVCRAMAANESGMSDVSPVSDTFRPCSGLIECSPAALPLIGGVLLLLLGATIAALVWLVRRKRVYVTAQVDDFASVSLGRGPAVGLRFVRRGPYRRLVGVAPHEGPDADVRIRYTGDEEFEVEAAGARTRVASGRLVEVADAQGETHGLVLRAFDGPPQGLRRVDDDDVTPDPHRRRP